MNTAKRWYTLLYVQVLFGIIIGGLFPSEWGFELAASLALVAAAPNAQTRLLALLYLGVALLDAGQYQVARRMRALLDDLVADLPERRRAALQRQSDLLADAVASAIPEGQRADALVADRQGIGMARH